MDLIIGYVMDVARWLLVLILAFLYPQDYGAWSGKVVKVIRADEIRVEKNGGTKTVRLYGIDSPIWWKQSKSASTSVPRESDLEKTNSDVDRKHKNPVPQNPGETAREYTIRRIMGKSVTVQPLPGQIRGPWYAPSIAPYDRHNRIIGLVTVDGVSLSRELLRKGLAWWYKPFVPFERGLKRLEDQAQKARRGLWANPDPIPPWKWQGTRLDSSEHPLQQKPAEGSAR